MEQKKKSNKRIVQNFEAFESAEKYFSFDIIFHFVYNTALLNDLLKIH